MAHETDVVIIGGGLVGASLALALEPLELSIDVLESIPFNHDAQPSFDERTIALTFGSRRVFEAIGIWSEIATDACPIHSIHVSDQGHFGCTHLDRSLINTDALGYVVPSRTLGHALLNRLQDSISIRYHAPAVVASLQTDGDFVNKSESVAWKNHTPKWCWLRWSRLIKTISTGPMSALHAMGHSHSYRPATSVSPWPGLCPRQRQKPTLNCPTTIFYPVYR